MNNKWSIYSLIPVVFLFSSIFTQSYAFVLKTEPYSYWFFWMGSNCEVPEYYSAEEACSAGTVNCYSSDYIGTLRGSNPSGTLYECLLDHVDGTHIGVNEVKLRWACADPNYILRQNPYTGAYECVLFDSKFRIEAVMLGLKTSKVQPDTRSTGDEFPSCPDPNLKHPINVVSGNKVLSQALNTISSQSLDFNYTYNSKASTTPGVIGQRWTHAYDRQVTVVNENIDNGYGNQIVNFARTYVSSVKPLPEMACTEGWQEVKPKLAQLYPFLADSDATYEEVGRCAIRFGSDRELWDVLAIKHSTEFEVDFDLNSSGYVPMNSVAKPFVYIKRADGATLLFQDAGSSSWSNISQTKDKLISLGEPGNITGWEYHTEDDVVEVYEANGKLLNITTPSGYSETLNYNGGLLSSVENNLGETLAFGYDANSRLLNVTDNAARTWYFNYDAVGNLQSVTNPDSTTKTYHYEDARFPHALTGITNENSDRYATYAYDENERGILTTLANNVDRLDIEYLNNEDRTVYSSRGIPSSYKTNTTGNAIHITQVSGPGCTSCGSGNSSYKYDYYNNHLTEKTENGLSTQYSGHDENGNPGYVVEAAGTPEERRIDYTYDARFRRKIASITEASVVTGQFKVTRYTYDDFGNRTSISVEGFAPDGQGGFNPTSRTVNFKYEGPLNSLSEVDGPRDNASVNDISRLIYYPNDAGQGNNRARLKQLIGPEGLILRDNIQYSATGKVISEGRPNGVTLSYAYYPGSDRLETLTESDGTISRVTQWTYLPTGDVESITQAFETSLASTVTLGYDKARRLISITDNIGNSILYTLDTEGNKLQEDIKDSDGVLYRTLQQTFDDYDRLDTLTLINEVYDSNYAADGTLSNQTDAKNISTNYNYDSLRRLTSVNTDAGGSDAATADTLTQYFYDVADRLTKVIAPNSAETSYVYDDLGNLLKEIGPDRGERTYSYDAAGNVITITYARNITVNYSYDGLSRVTAIDYPGDAEDIAFTYESCANGIGKLCQVTDQSGLTQYEYDKFGNLTSQVKTESGITYTTQYTYDLLNRINSMTTPAGRVVTYHHNSLGQVSAIDAMVNSTMQTIVHNAQYRADGLLANMAFGNGFEEERFYNLRGQLTNLSMPVSSVTLPLTANAGINQNVNEGDAVTLNASLSTGSITAYQWEIYTGATVSLFGANTATPSFTAPETVSVDVIVFQLTVTNGMETDTDFTVVTVNNVNSIPIADAGLDQLVAENQLVTLNATGSTDSDGFIRNYLWQQTGGPSVIFKRYDQPTLSFTTPLVDREELYTFKLTVTDDKQAIAEDTVYVRVQDVENVFWTDLVKVTPSGNSVTKIVAQLGEWDAGAASVQRIEGDGAVEIYVDSNDRTRAFGLSYVNLDNSLDSFDYAMSLGKYGDIIVREGLVGYTPGITYVVGDILRIERIGETVYYKKNGVTFYTSTKPSSGSMLLDVAIYSPSSSIKYAKVYGAAIDETAPVISNIQSQSFASDYIISWNTDEGSSTQVQWGVNSVNENSSTIDPLLVKQHSVTVTGLTAGTTYQYQVISVDAYGNTTVSALQTFSTPNPPEPVVWTELVGVTVNGNLLTKTDPVVGWNAGAASVQHIDGDGAVEVTVASNSTDVAIGLTYQNTNTDKSSVDYTIHMGKTGELYLQELGSGFYPGITFVTGDVLAIERVGTTVKFKKNGAVIYTSPTPSSGRLIADAMFYYANHSIKNAIIYGSGVDSVAPVISNIGVTKSNNTLTVNWTTDEPTYAHITYGLLSADEFSTTPNTQATSDHSYTMTNLPPGRTYQYRIVSKDRVGNETISATSSFVTPDYTVNNIYWFNHINTSMSGNVITKTAGATSSWDAGADSSQLFRKDGAVEFTVPQSNSYNLMFGISAIYGDVNFNVMSHALYLIGGGTFTIYESGVNIGSQLGKPGNVFGNWAQNDIFRVERRGGIVRYYKNAALVHTSASSSSGNVHADLSLKSRNYSRVSNAKIYEFASPDNDNDGMADDWESAHGLDPNNAADAQLDSDNDGMSNFVESQLGSNPQLDEAQAQVGATSEPVSWTNLINAAANGSTLTKTAGSTPSWNAGASSVQKITGNGALEYTVNQTIGAWRIVGLGYTDPDALYYSIAYGFYTYEDRLYIKETAATVASVGSYAVGDVLKIARIDNAVYYYKNDIIVYASTNPSVGDLIADVSIATMSTNISNATIYQYVQNGGQTASISDSEILRHSVSSANATERLPLLHNTSRLLPVSSETAESSHAKIVSLSNERQLVVVTDQHATHAPYRVYRKGPETNNTWVQTAEDPNAYDRPDSVIYLTDNTLDAWTQLNGESIERQHLAIDDHTLNAGTAHNATQNLGAQSVFADNFIAVNHGTPGNPVAIDSEIWTYRYDANGNVEHVTKSQVENSYAYDALNRVIDDTPALQSSITYDYDRNGNRTQFTVDSVIDSYGYNTNSNVLNSDAQGSVQHDAAGNRTSDQGGSRIFEYNNAGRLHKVFESGQLIATYFYNAQGQRTRKTTSAGTTIYHYDLLGNLIAETTGSGQAQKDYVYLNSVPVAQIDTTVTNDVVNYLHTDHLGTPRRATNAGGEVTWSWDSDAFGTTAANEDVDNDGQTTNINLRFAGQYFDHETGLHYNWNRYYSPSEGRYITSDPVGLWGGLNTYSYTYQNPINYYDLEGATPVHALRGSLWVGTRIGAGISYAIEAAFGAGLGILIYDALHNESSDESDVSPKSCGANENADNKGSADTEREKSRAKGIPDSEIGPSGKPKIHVINHPSKKKAKDAAQQDGKGPPMHHPSPTRGKPHYHPTDATGDKIPGPHHQYPK